MKDEIKEILDKFEFVKKEPNKLSYYPEDLLSREEMWLLYDYIINLQGRIDKATEYIKEHTLYSFDLYDKDDVSSYFEKASPKDLLNILQGSDNND